MNLSYVEERFKALAKKWHEETGFSSNLTYKWSNRHYQQILGLGRAVVPVIMEDMRQSPDWWFDALRKLTGHEPEIDPETESGYLKIIAQKWLTWWDGQKDTWFRKEQELFALKWETGIFHSFYPSEIQMSLCGDPPYYRVRLTPDPEGGYWAWHDFVKDVYNFTNHNREGVVICFPYGPEIEEKLGRGEIIRVRVDELGVA